VHGNNTNGRALWSEDGFDGSWRVLVVADMVDVSFLQEAAPPADVTCAFEPLRDSVAEPLGGPPCSLGERERAVIESSSFRERGEQLSPTTASVTSPP
jgi:hypothetical protein